MAYSKFRKKKKSAPWVGSMLLQLPDGAERRVKLPSVEGYEIGDKVQITYEYKSRSIRIPLVRIEGGWDVVQ